MKILITGDKGFIGRHLRQSLISDGHIVLGIDINNLTPVDALMKLNKINKLLDS